MIAPFVTVCAECRCPFRTTSIQAKLCSPACADARHQARDKAQRAHRKERRETQAEALARYASEAPCLSWVDVRAVFGETFSHLENP